MPRTKRISPTGFVQHVLNRGDHRETLFHKPGDFLAFLRVVTDTTVRLRMRILAYCIMRNHFHLLLWPYHGDDLPPFMQLLMNTHIRRYLGHYPPSSPGHIYQARYTNCLVEPGSSVLAVARYIEANALAAGLVRRAEDYPWSSASPYAEDVDRPCLSDWPVAKPGAWSTLLNQPTPSAELKRIQRCARRGAPYGSPAWTRRVAKRFALEHTVRLPGRPPRHGGLVIDPELEARP
jgi:putative transposase